MFFEAARKGKNQWWLYIIGFLLVFVGYGIGQMPLMLVAKYYYNATDDILLSYEQVIRSMDFDLIGLNKNLTLALLLLTFVSAMLLLWFVIAVLHRRPFLTLINPFGKVRWDRYFYGFKWWAAIIICMEVVNFLIQPQDYTWQFDIMPFMGLLLVAVLMLPIQTAFEELFARGYLMHGVGLVFGSRLAGLLLSSGVFMALHLMNPEFDAFNPYILILYYLSMGLFLGYLTLQDDGLELAMGIHLANNLFSALFVTFSHSAIQTYALFEIAKPNEFIMLVQSLIAILLFGFLAHRKYKFPGFQSLFRPLETWSSETIKTPLFQEKENQ